MRKTKIVCTLGPSTDNIETMRALAKAGMNVARMNFSHGSYEEHLGRLNMLRQVREELDMPIAALLDTKGPEIRVKSFENGKVFINEGEEFTLTTRDIIGSEKEVSITYAGLPRDVSEGTRLLLDDGLIELRVNSVTETDINCTVINGGPVSDKKSVNVPGVSLNMPYMSEKDREDILFGIKNGYDFIAASFVRSAADILEIRAILDKEKCDSIRIIAKIENAEGVDNIDEILSVSDGVMVARGDMGVEIDFAEIPIIQKALIQKCYNLGKPVITATQMLDSMMSHPRPTRAEITDVANAIYDGTSAIMLSGETAAGKYPIEAVKTMNAIALRTEADINYNKRLMLRRHDAHTGVADAVARAACTTAMDLGANAIITTTRSGETARLVSKNRPQQPIIACVISESVYRRLALSWGVVPIMMPVVETTDESVEICTRLSRQKGYVKDGDLVVITAGGISGMTQTAGTTNMIKIQLIGEFLQTGIGVGRKSYTGRLCICKHEADIAQKFKAGDILVMPATSNNIIEYMKAAGAIITEEAGLNSHAAIVGLTLEKPVIVGAQNATANLRDGAMVAVDAERNVVRTIAK